MLSAEELLAGSSLSYDFEVPSPLLGGASSPESQKDSSEPGIIRLRPLTVNDLQLISRAAKENDMLNGALMVHRALVNPQLSLTDVQKLPIGLMKFILSKVNEISGLEKSPDFMDNDLEAPLVKAAFILAKEFGWTPQQIHELTLGQILLHLQMLKENTYSHE